MNRPKINQAEALSMIVKSGYTIPEKIIVLAIRGYYRDSMGEKGENDRGIYDDAFVLIGPNYFKTFNANTDPSRQKAAIATLVTGLHYFKKGKHGISRGNPYDAFRPATPDESLPVTRDGQPRIQKGIAINIHSGGDVYTNSAGCQTVIREQWKEFQGDAYKLLEKEGQRLLPYLLVENK